MRQRGIGRVDGWIVGLVGLLLYGVTAGPGIVALFDDSLEFQLVAPTFAIAHPTGYPLYTLLGGLWSRLLFPFGNWAWRMNLFSALAGAGTIALLYLLARRLTGGNPWAGLAAVLAFAFGPVWWAQTTVAEVYALHNFFVTALLYTAVSLDEQPSARQVAFLCGLAGLSLTHHRTALLLLPGLALYLLWSRPGLRRPQSAWLLWIGAFLIPLLLYVYIPLRAALGGMDLEGDYVNSWAGFWRHVLASGYAGFFADNPLSVDRTALEWLGLVRTQFGWPALLLGAGGLVIGLLHPSRRNEWGLVWLSLAANLLFALNYRVSDVEVFWLPVFLALALGTGNGIHWLSRLNPGLGLRESTGGWPKWALLLGLLLLVASGWGGRGGLVDRRHDWAAHAYAYSLASTDFPLNSRVVGLRGQMTALQFMQSSEGLAANALAVALDNPEERREFVVASLAAGLPVYLTQEVAGIEDAYSFGGDGVLVRVWPRGTAQSAQPTTPLDLSFADGQLQLLGYDLTALDQPGGAGWRVVLHWRPVTPLPQRLKLSLRLMDSSGGVMQAEDRYPLRQVAPTTAWLPGEVVRDVYNLPGLPAATALLVIVYDEATVAEVGQVTLPLR